MRIIHKILWRIALIFRFKSKKYADYFFEEMHERTKKIVDSIDLDSSEIRILKTK
jgi:hypothetical protein